MDAAIWQDSEGRGCALKRAASLALLVQMAVAPRLWLAERDFPTLPAIDGLPNLPSLPTWLLLSLSAAGLSGTVLRPKMRAFGLLVLVSVGLLVLFDIDRLQPWLYQLLLIIGVLSALPNEDAPKIVGFVLAATYIWSGHQKLNGAFARDVFPWLLSPLGLENLRGFWPVAPISEIGIGLLLLLPKMRQYGVVGAVVLHTVLLVALGPLGRNFNPAVWPWNLWLPILVLLSFWRNSDPISPSVARTWTGRFIFLLVGAVPALNWFGGWDDYLSASLYSGKSRQSFLLFTPEAAQKLPLSIQPYVQRRSDRIGLDLSRWSMAELGVPVYPELRVYRALARKLVRAAVPREGMRLVVTKPLDPKPRAVEEIQY